MSSKSFILGLILSIGMIGCEKEKEKTETFDTFSISYLRASSWVDYYYEAIINQNGLLRVSEESKLNNLNRESEYQISNTDIALIKEKLSEVVSTDFKDTYGFGDDKPTDLPVTFIQYIVDNKADSTAILFPQENELPKALDSFLKVIKQIVVDNDTNSF
jgi:hypothetical protein